jgi:hypothetical protein
MSPKNLPPEATQQLQDLSANSNNATNPKTPPDQILNFNFNPVIPVNQSNVRCITVIFYFEDPGIQIFFKQFLSLPENKPLLLLYEQQLPSWTIVLA